MSCCPTPPEVNVGDSADGADDIEETEILPGESVECFMKRANNVTGKMDDKTENIPGKIENTDVPLKDGITVDVIFRVTLGEKFPKATAWTFECNPPLPAEITTGVVTDKGEVCGFMKGTFPASTFSKSHKLMVSVTMTEGSDKRAFVFAPAKATGSNEIRFVHPLPGARVTSRFGPRIAPTAGASTQHGGADFSVAPKPPIDVLAAADGEITFTGYQAGGAGKYVKIKHLNAAGKELCTTVYMHLADIYVTQGQRVVAGQKIGKEGNTGVGTGPHLHFECRLPNGTKIDPVPLIKGSVDVARQTNPDNTAVESTVEPRADNGALTPENVEAKQNGCEPFGEDYPKDPKATNEEPPSDISDPFEKAWFYTMKHEVGPFWTEAFPQDTEVQQGLIETAPQRKKVGYVQLKGDTGGKTKFGISQNNNTAVKVSEMGYSLAKKTGFNNYWKAGKCDVMAKTKPKTAVLLFDITFLCGSGGANKVKSGANMDASDDATVESLAVSWENHLRKIAASKPESFLRGWMTRVKGSLANAKSFKAE